MHANRFSLTRHRRWLRSAKVGNCLPVTPTGRYPFAALLFVPLALSFVGCQSETKDPVVAVDFIALCQEDLGLEAEACEYIADWRLPDELPPARGNLYGDNLEAARLGHEIFFDVGFATVKGVSCASCHAPEQAFQDGLAVPEVLEGYPGKRNSPTLYNTAWLSGFYFWDGRADSLWSQPLFAFENDIEMATTRLEIAHRVAAEYQTPYESVFGSLPDLADSERFPASGMPGSPAWDSMASEDQDAVNRVAANVGKALEAYMRKLATGPAPIDHYIDGDMDALSAGEKQGFVRYVRSGCLECHTGPTMTDEVFRQGSDSAKLDRGRAVGVEILLDNPFNSLGSYYDAEVGTALPLPDGPRDEDEGAFRTPSMRNVLLTAPYRHSGNRSMDEVLRGSGAYEAGDEVSIAEFFAALNGEPPAPEWNGPPSR